MQRQHQKYGDNMNSLKLADGLEKIYGLKVEADELRRLHEVNVELMGVLQEIRDNYDCDEDAHKYGSRCRSCVARAAIAKATGGQQ